MRFSRKITIIQVRKPKETDVNKDLQYFGSALGLFGLRDKDKSCYRIFLELLKAAKQKLGLSSDELAYKLSLTRGTVVHHLNKLMDAGIAVNIRNRYYLREENLEIVINEIKKDLASSMDDLATLAKEIDVWMGL
ncbi:helix-turn-helix transcriptional regulator [Candidatus Woesearchaeota archaeon]|jgi:predicted transcriptional regulator|nr:helix-turn-helix transcriptional regulator [Candidatus Woesearchaeota archaeon]MBT4368450.1 helix-turn-helix transcriptional regulator [Candidatus Woesearchaeota archaeon]MBT4712939.1 helix-turn-helix transcriptional regulator [Candidatus Woesearchaeota archaeon]MBT6639851.1 helix-turn-helix transcriptional regulator [Candidatus Woesearchaeota archaeon]MBT7134023.1 helix-turn-helix transcriptional regulator [Candidatus Woesearchaeota archaeon]